jgi:DNA-directed RNA polymerase subunit RPC12/RpoP
MKCIRCKQDSEYKQRTDRRCPHCGGEIAFEPREGDPISDDMFARVLHLTSAGGSVRYCKQHVYYDTWRQLGMKPAKFDELWDRWCAVHGTPEGLVTPWPARWDAGAREPDLGDYSFDRVIICDNPWIVDFLLANNFHFETSSAILTIDGYPNDRFATIRAMLQRNPRIIVLAVHDASYEGCRIAKRLVSEDGWFRELGHVVDIGLLAEHRFSYKQYCYPRAEPAPLDGESPDARWLSTHRLDLSIVRPERTLRRLFRATRVYASLWTQPIAHGQVHLDPELLAPHQGRGW